MPPATSLGHTLVPVNSLRRPFLALAWLLVAVLLALGGAGVVARADNFPGDELRPELTWRYDRAMAPGIAAAGEEAGRIAQGTDRLADAARSALVHLLAGQTEAVADDLSLGDVWLDDIERRTTLLEGMVADLPHVDSPELYGSGTRARVEALRRVAEAVHPLRARWTQLERATIPAVEIADVLQAHDATAFAATQAGVREDYTGALAILDEATARLDEAAALRDELATAIDVSTLTEWIERNRLHDEALRDLYGALRSGDAVKIKAAIEKQRQAQALLPPDTRALVVILGDIALGGVTQAAIAIDGVRGSLADSIAALD